MGVDRLFWPFSGDRVARVSPGRDSPSTTNLSEAMDYARYRAEKLGTRQFVRPHNKRGWYLVYNTDVPLREEYQNGE